MRKVKDVKKAMKETQEDLNRDREAEFNHWKLQKSKEDEDRKRKFEEEKVKANQLRQINDVLERLNVEK